jgi:predicted SprT family Zn-dependent metalloprotease
VNLTHAEAIATTLMKEYGIWDKGWRFQWNNNKTRLGLCRYGVKTLEMSRLHVPHNDVEFVNETMLHEIAHAIAGSRAAHGWEWQRVYRSIGGNGQRTGNSAAQLQTAWTGKCSNGHSTSQHRAPLRVHSCGKCYPRFKPEFIYVWAKNGRNVPPCEMPDRYRTELVRMTKTYGAERIPRMG